MSIFNHRDLAYIATKCEHVRNPKSLCQLLRRIHLQNEELDTVLLEDDLRKDIRETVMLTNHKVTRALNSTDNVRMFSELYVNEMLYKAKLRCKPQRT
ncbi:hypothetical protein Q1695_005123 [Nippostrongylus brasiliensis]|nr:hypothetical protein Q1695_005123 [Nippostrongylus brasiliensis]